MKQTFQVIHMQSHQQIVNNLKIANHFFSRLIGLMWSKPLSLKSGLLISPCQQVHTHFMKYAIDVVFLDKQYKIVHIALGMKPWRFSNYIKPAYYVLELAENTAKDMNLGDTLTITCIDSHVL